MPVSDSIFKTSRKVHNNNRYAGFLQWFSIRFSCTPNQCGMKHPHQVKEENSFQTYFNCFSHIILILSTLLREPVIWLAGSKNTWMCMLIFKSWLWPLPLVFMQEFWLPCQTLNPFLFLPSCLSLQRDSSPQHLILSGYHGDEGAKSPDSRFRFELFCCRNPRRGWMKGGLKGQTGKMRGFHSDTRKMTSRRQNTF